MTNTELKKLIEDNSNEFTDPERLQDFISDYGDKTNSNIKDLEDNIAEQADGLVPIYYHKIMEEWKNNAECHELTVEVCGEYAEKDIYKMMQSDLYFYYEQRLQADYQALLTLLEDVEEEPETPTE